MSMSGCKQPDVRYWPTQANAMSVFSYIVTHDSGFAPNPFWGFCTLACCKPMIRKTAVRGDWIVELSPKKLGNRLVFVMEVTEDPLTFEHGCPTIYGGFSIR